MTFVVAGVSTQDLLVPQDCSKLSASELAQLQLLTHWRTLRPTVDSTELRLCARCGNGSDAVSPCTCSTACVTDITHHATRNSRDMQIPPGELTFLLLKQLRTCYTVPRAHKANGASRTLRPLHSGVEDSTSATRGKYHYLPLCMLSDAH